MFGAIDLDTIPRPQRSGVISCLTAYALVWILSMSQLPSYEGLLTTAAVLQTALCYMMPWECLSHKEKPQAPKQEVIHLYFDPRPLRRQKHRKDKCILEVHHEGGNKGQEYSYLYPAKYDNSCVVIADVDFEYDRGGYLTPSYFPLENRWYIVFEKSEGIIFTSRDGFLHETFLKQGEKFRWYFE